MVILISGLALTIIHRTNRSSTHRYDNLVDIGQAAVHVLHRLHELLLMLELLLLILFVFIHGDALSDLETLSARF